MQGISRGFYLRSLGGAPASGGLFLASCILWLAASPPGLGPAVFLEAAFLPFVMVFGICDAVKAIPGRMASALQPRPGEVVAAAAA